MQCVIYKSQRKADTYLYLARRDTFDVLPPALLSALGRLVHVMDLEITPDRKLARENTVEVLRQLGEKGWFVQMPRPEDMAGAWRNEQTPAWTYRD